MVGMHIPSSRHLWQMLQIISGDMKSGMQVIKDIKFNPISMYMVKIQVLSVNV